MYPNLVASSLVFKISRFIGCMPYDSRGKLSKFLTTYSLLVTLGIAASFIGVRAERIRRLADSSSLPTLTRITTLVITLSVIGTNLVHAFVTVKKRMAFEYLLQRVTCPSFCSCSDYIILLIAKTAYVATAYSRYQLNYNEAYSSQGRTYTLLLITQHCAKLYNFMIVMQFVSVIGALTAHVKTLKSTLWRNLHDTDFFELLTAAKTVNENYTVQITLTLFQLSGIIVMYSSIFWVDADIAGINVKSAAAMTLINSAELWMIIDRAHRFYQSAEAFNNELFKLMRSNNELCRDRKLFLYVTMRQSVRFTACGFFNLGYPLVTSIIAAATTYLVILLQFSM